MRSDNQKVHERLVRLEIATPTRAKETQRILFNDLKEEVEEGSTYTNKGKTKDRTLGSIKMKIPAF